MTTRSRPAADSSAPRWGGDVEAGYRPGNHPQVPGERSDVGEPYRLGGDPRVLDCQPGANHLPDEQIQVEGGTAGRPQAKQGMELVRCAASLLSEEPPAGCQHPRHFPCGEGFVAIKNKIESHISERKVVRLIAGRKRIVDGTLGMDDGNASAP